MHRLVIRPFILALSLFIFVSPVLSGEELKNQDLAIKKMKKIKSKKYMYLSYKRYSSLVSTYFATKGGVTQELLDKHQFEPLYLTNEEGYQAEGYIYVPEEPRAFIVCVAGIGGTKTSDSLRMCAREVRKRHNVGVVIFENPTGADWIRRNFRIMVSGYETGWDLYLNLKALRGHPVYGPFIKELNLIGFSLGGNDVSYASYFDSVKETNVIDGSVMTVSGPANRYEAIRHVRRKVGVLGYVIRSIMRESFRGGLEVIRQYSDITEDEFAYQMPMDDLTAELFLPAAREYLLNHPHHLDQDENNQNMIQLPIRYAEELTVEHVKQMFQHDKYLPKVTKPILFLHAKNDKVVTYKNIRDTVSLYDDKPNIGFRITKWGGHIGFYSAYGRGWLSRNILRYVQYWGKFDKEHYELP